MKKLPFLIPTIAAGLLLAQNVFALSVYQPVQGGTGTGVIPTIGQVLVGQSNGKYAPQATSTLGITVSGGNGTVGTSTPETFGYFPTWGTTNGSPALLAGTSSLFQLNGRIGAGSTSPAARFSIHDNTGGVASSTLEFSIASSTAAGTATTTLFTVDGFGSTTIKGSVGIAGGLMNDNNGRISLGVGISGVNKAKCGVVVLDNFAAGCSGGGSGSFITGNISNDTNFPGYSAATFTKGNNTQVLNSAGSNAVMYVGQVNSTNNTTAAIWNQTQTTNAINTGTSYGYISQDYLQGTGQLGNYVAFQSQGSYATAGPTVTNQYDFKADPFTSLVNGTTTNRYGLYVGYDSTSITNPYGVYQLSPTVKNYLAGNVGFGSTSPAARVAIVSGVGSTTDLLVVASSSNTQYVTVKSTGRVGIGTTTPIAALSLASSTTAAGGINLGDSLTNLYRSYDGMTRTDGGFTAGGGQFIVNSTGSITSSPGATFSNIYLNGTNITTIPTGVVGFTPLNWYDAPDTAISRVSAGKLGAGNGTAGDTSATIIAAGVGVGTSTPSTSVSVYGGGVSVNPGATSKPTCSLPTRGTIWNTLGGAGVADLFQICQKDAADAYAWVTK